MRLVTFHNGISTCLGLVQEDQVVDLSMLGQGAYPALPATMTDLIAAGPAVLGGIRRLLETAPGGCPAAAGNVRLLAPIPRPRKNVFCVGMNYLAHAQESARVRGRSTSRWRIRPFSANATATVTGSYDDILPHRRIGTGRLEVELAVVIGAEGCRPAPGIPRWTMCSATMVSDRRERPRGAEPAWRPVLQRQEPGWLLPDGPLRSLTADEIQPPGVPPAPHASTASRAANSMTADMIFSIARSWSNSQRA